jgi:restriction system protein
MRHVAPIRRRSRPRPVSARRAPTRRSNPVTRATRWLLGIALLFAATWAAVRLLVGAEWAARALIALAALVLLVALLSLRRSLGRRRSFGRLLAGSPTEFEEAVAAIMRRQGFRGVRRTGGSGDLTADVVAHDRSGRTVVVQCKRYAPGKPVGSKELQTFIGMQRIHHEADYGLYVTTSTYTAPARSLAERHGVTLVDGAELTAILSGDRGRTWMRR